MRSMSAREQKLEREKLGIVALKRELTTHNGHMTVWLAQLVDGSIVPVRTHTSCTETDALREFGKILKPRML
jgi:hypothetical protein